MGPPYTKQNNKLLYDLIKAQAEAPEDWPWYPIDLRGHAKTFKEGEPKIRLLQKQPYAYSTDSETRGKLKADAMTDLYRKKMKEQPEKTVEDILSMSEASFSSAVSASNDESPSSEEESTKYSRIKTKSVIRKEVTPTRNQKSVKSAESKNRDTAAKAPASTCSMQITNSSKMHSKSTLPNKINPTQDIGTSKHLLTAIKRKAGESNLVGVNASELEDDSEIEGTMDQPSKEFVANLPKETAFIYLAVTKLKVAIDSMAQQMEALRNSVERVLKTKVDQVSIVSFCEKYDFKKLTTVEELEAFNLRLENDVEYVKDLKAAMECMLDSELRQTITGIIKKLFHRELAMKCTAFRKSNDKFLLKGTSFYNLTFEFVSRFHHGRLGKVVTEKDFYHTLSSCLTNSKDWDGNRKLRAMQPVAVANREN